MRNSNTYRRWFIVFTCVLLLLIGMQASASSASKRARQVKQLFGILQGYSDRIEKQEKKKIYWSYSRKGVERTFAKADARNNRKCSCAWMVNWALRDMKILRENQTIYPNKKGELIFKKQGNTHTEEAIRKKFVLLNMGDKSPQELFQKGKLKPGDICIYKIKATHMNVFVGADKEGNLLWYDAGRVECGGGKFIKGSKKVDGKEKYVYHTFGPLIENEPIPVHQILRFK